MTEMYGDLKMRCELTTHIIFSPKRTKGVALMVLFLFLLRLNECGLKEERKS